MADPNNILNQNLGLGGNLSLGGNLAVLGDTALDGDVVITGDTVAAGPVVSGNAFRLITPTLGSLSLDYTEVLVTLTGATTTFSFGASGLPAGALAFASSIRVVTTITGITSTLGTLNLNPITGSSFAGSINAFTAGTTASSIGPSGTVINSADADAGAFVLSGGLNVPSAGSIRVTVYFWRATAPTS